MWNVSLDGPSRRIIAEPADDPGPARAGPGGAAARARSGGPGARAVTAAPPLVPSAVYGLRTWTVDRRARARAARRAAPRRHLAGGRRVAGRHVRDGARGAGGRLPLRPPRVASAPPLGAPRLAARGEVAGIVEARGTIELHHDGLRAQRARPYALVRTRRSNPALLDRLAAAYGLPLVDARGPDDLVAWCREHGLGLSEEVVASLLGPRERERRQLAPVALRLAAVAAVVAALVLLGISHDPKGERDLYGRTGPVHVKH